MTGSQGYSLEQLLAWSLEDRLIDGYEWSGDLLVIVQGAKRRAIRSDEAHHVLKGMFRRHLSGRVDRTADASFDAQRKAGDRPLQASGIA